MIYKNYFMLNKSSQFCMGEEADFFECEDEAIDEIIQWHCDNKYVYSHTLAITEYGHCEVLDLQVEAWKRCRENKAEGIAEQEHINSHSVEMRNK